jgi:hypothetical protein
LGHGQGAPEKVEEGLACHLITIGSDLSAHLLPSLSGSKGSRDQKRAYVRRRHEHAAAGTNKLGVGIDVCERTQLGGVWVSSEGGRDGSNGWYSVDGCLVEVVVSPRYYRGAIMDELSLDGKELIVPL